MKTYRELVSALVWSSEHEANESIRYNHVLADSPLGQFSIEWKGWKDHDSYGTYLDGYYLDSANDLDEAKLIAEKCLADKAHELFEFFGVDYAVICVPPPIHYK